MVYAGLQTWARRMHSRPFLHARIDSVTRRCGEKSTNRVKNPRVGWAGGVEGGDRGLSRGMK